MRRSHHVLLSNQLSAKINGTQRRTLVGPWRMQVYGGVKATLTVKNQARFVSQYRVTYAWRISQLPSKSVENSIKQFLLNLVATCWRDLNAWGLTLPILSPGKIEVGWCYIVDYTYSYYTVLLHCMICLDNSRSLWAIKGSEGVAELPARCHHNQNSSLNSFHIWRALPCYLKPYKDCVLDSKSRAAYSYFGAFLQIGTWQE